MSPESSPDQLNALVSVAHELIKDASLLQRSASNVDDVFPNKSADISTEQCLRSTGNNAAECVDSNGNGLVSLAEMQQNQRAACALKDAVAQRQTFWVWRSAGAANTRLCDAWIVPLLNDPRALLIWMYLFDHHSALDFIDNEHVDGLGLAELAVKWAVVPSYPLLRMAIEHMSFFTAGALISYALSPFPLHAKPSPSHPQAAIWTCSMQTATAE